MRARSLALMFAGAIVCLAGSGCSKLDLIPNWGGDNEDELNRNVRAALRGEAGQSRLIGDYIRISDSSMGSIKVQGVGLVDRLDGTGDDPPASPHRQRLLDDMRHYDIKDPETYLRSSSTALVIVTAYVPPIIRKGEKIDVRITVPPGSTVSSLAGGYLMPCRLSEHAYMGGQVRDGKDLAIAVGPVLVSALNLDEKSASRAHQEGIIPGGATYIGDDRHLKIGIRNEYRTVRMANQIATQIGKRFYDYDEGGIQRPLAKALNNVELDLIVHQRYRDNFARYLQVIRHIVLNESEVQRHLRMTRLKEDVKVGPLAERAALELEAVGPEAIPILEEALSTSSSLEARFHIGVALTYLGSPAGVQALKEAADKEPAFRIFALAALSTLDDGRAADALRELMNHSSIETRYGAFRALTTMAPNDPSVDGVKMAQGGFSVHPVESTAEPLIHITRYKKAEIVLFGADQRFQMPLFLRAGTHIMVRGTPLGDAVVVTRIAPGEGTREQKTTTEIGQVIKTAAELGANYPDIVQMLIQAEQQHNLPGQIAIDALPRPGRVYVRPMEDVVSANEESRSVQVGNAGTVPNIFEDVPAADVQQTPLPAAQPDASEEKSGPGAEETNKQEQRHEGAAAGTSGPAGTAEGEAKEER